MLSRTVKLTNITDIVGFDSILVLIPLFCLKSEVNSLMQEEICKNGYAEFWTPKCGKKQSNKTDCYDELRIWVQKVILEAKESNDTEKRNKFSALLREL